MVLIYSSAASRAFKLYKECAISMVSLLILSEWLRAILEDH